jgi:hypothetical protein
VLKETPSSQKQNLTEIESKGAKKEYFKKWTNLKEKTKI